MATVTYAYYKDIYLGEPIADTDFPRAEAAAERLVNQITRGRAVDLAALPPALQDAVKNAICAQVEYYALNGVEVSIGGKMADSWTVGRVHVSEGSSAAAKIGPATMVCPNAVSILEQTGLLNPAVPVLDLRGVLG